MTNATRAKWSSMTVNDMEWHFNPRHAVSDSERYGEARLERNQIALTQRQADIRYGDQWMQDLDIYPVASGEDLAPVHVFIHGGYWRSRVKEDFAFVGPELNRHGVLGVVINYPLCPAVTLDVVVASARLAMDWVGREIWAYGGDPERISLSGHSSGAHLGAAILTQEAAVCNLRGAVLISGIYDPAPAQRISVNAELNLNETLCDRHDYLSVPRMMTCPLKVIVGADEPAGWIEQSLTYAEHAALGDGPVDCLLSAGDNHFSILDQYFLAGSDIMSSVLEQVTG